MNERLKRAPLRRVLGIAMTTGKISSPRRFRIWLECGHRRFLRARPESHVPCLTCLALAQGKP